MGKLRLRDRILDSMALRGDERVLDVGCGRGLMLIGAAKRLTSGKSIGIDIWQTEDQAGSSPDNAWRNAGAEGVRERIEIKNADARDMPFPDGHFDLVVSSWALHNIYSSDDRNQALREVMRVLRPGGRLVIVDIRHAGEYAEFFRDNGMADVELKGPNFLFVIPSFTVTAVKRRSIS